MPLKEFETDDVDEQMSTNAVDQKTDQEDDASSYHRREFLKRAGLTGAAMLAAPSLLDNAEFDVLAQTTQAGAGAQTTNNAIQTVAVQMRINGTNQNLRLDPRVTVLDLLRERLDLTGTKKGCNHGQCGACTVLVNGERVNSCLALAVQHDGDEITTIEGLANGNDLHPVQTAFIENDGFQCGYCTPGQICSAVGMLREVEAGTLSHVTADKRQAGRVQLTDDEIRERMSGNLCRCGAYPNIVAAVKQAAGIGGGNTTAQVTVERNESAL